MKTVYLAIKHPPHPYSHGGHLKAGTVEKASFDRKEIAELVSEKNRRADYLFWSIRAIRVGEKA